MITLLGILLMLSGFVVLVNTGFNLFDRKQITLSWGGFNMLSLAFILVTAGLFILKVS